MLRLAVILLVLAAPGCEPSPPAAEPAATAPPPETTSARQTPAAGLGEEADRLRIVVVGDSLAAGYGRAEELAFPARVEASLRERGWQVEIVNGGVSGDTTAGGLARLDWLLRLEPDIVVLELGANDGLRGQPIEAIAGNLRRMVERSRDAGARVLLVGMRIPPNYGEDYAQRFAAVYPSLAAELDVPLVPFLLDGVAGLAEVNLPDGLHPNAEGHARVAAGLVPHLEPIVRQVAEAGTTGVPSAGARGR
jgi:acyl-CoA thioesterase-1